jgi:hypothetical protein
MGIGMIAAYWQAVMPDAHEQLKRQLHPSARRGLPLRGGYARWNVTTDFQLQ